MKNLKEKLRKGFVKRMVRITEKQVHERFEREKRGIYVEDVDNLQVATSPSIDQSHFELNNQAS